MTSGYRVHLLHTDDAPRAYGLIQVAAPCFSADDWGEVVASADRWTLVSLKDPAGYVRGLAAYRIGTHPIARRLMDVPIFVAASVIDDVAIADVLFTSLRRRSAGCDFMRLWGQFPSDFAEMEDEDKFCRWDHGLMVRVDQKPSPALL
ncbi:hypothetical protein ELI49_34965 [Rhizobium ruizarguesonis]|jgi:hypothetical protein|uniref:Uncharacterized protein n=1 Tax=Rhizobium ruizarguesonis TaxID=2081791 RepID=A0AAE8TZK0_9HYPH|nr:hypothetical protein [Rhizobium ruizarguesonis]QIO49380.1 hypothetical protein HA464_36140 [Rhizobium leguminosarum bv. trifolii]TAT70115.1 hypothetical protein ELI52_37925 [Rhizobium ruizarguesonis]TAT71296.1 hypothetical protein ELI56_33390 [Rhizobium ruizarguesonis]TAT72560.1 hypothetical protein ELI54_37195 [Rhizobium ruizarguesonis]TAT91545.1 hypothetical protein ELI55_38325 [Rhizobium ruizarguesonis]